MILNRILLIIILFASVGFFEIKYISPSIIKLIQFLTVGLILFNLIIRKIYGLNTVKNRKFVLPILFILIGVLLSSFIAYKYHEQKFSITFWAQGYMYWWLFYFYLSENNYKREELEWAILFIAFLYFIFFIIQFTIYPTVIFDVRMDNDPSRGTLRVFLPGYTLLTIGYFISLNKFFVTNKLFYLIPVLLFFSVPVLQATRQSIFSFFIITLFSILFSKNVKSRTSIIFIISLSIIPLFFIFKEIILNLIELSTSQSGDASYDAREIALKFFLVDFFPSKSAYILGNGADHMWSAYGVKISNYKRLGLYQSDIGFIGEYSKYGLLFVLGACIMVIKFFKFKTTPELAYIKYYGFSIVLLLPLASFFTTPSAIAVLCILAHIIDIESESG